MTLTGLPNGLRRLHAGTIMSASRRRPNQFAHRANHDAIDGPAAAGRIHRRDAFRSWVSAAVSTPT